MNESEFAELLQFVQRRMQAMDLGAMNDRAVSAVRHQTGRPSELLDVYLEALEFEWLLESRETERRIVRRLQEVAETEGGDEIEGIVVELSPSDRELFGRDRINLSEVSDRLPAIEQLRALRAELREQRESD